MSDQKKPEELGANDLDMAVGGKSEAPLSTAKDEQRVKLTAVGEEDNKLTVSKGEQTEKLTVAKGEQRQKQI